MTLVDAATALIDEKKKGGAEKKQESLSIVQPNARAKETHSGDEPSTTPPPGTGSDTRGATLISPSTPKTNNRTLSTPALPPGFPPQKQSFARDLMDVLLDEANNDIITFLPDGDDFAILEPKAFAEKLMPSKFKPYQEKRYRNYHLVFACVLCPRFFALLLTHLSFYLVEKFGIKTFSPFVRKLHRWGFERIMDKKTHAVDVFRHPLFIRGNFILCDKIRCIGRLVKGPLEEAILSQAGLSSTMGRKIGMPTHQEFEIRNFCERMQNIENRRKAEAQHEMAAQAYLLEQATRQIAVRRQQQDMEEQLLKDAQYRQAAAREAAARQLLQRQMAEQSHPTASQLLLNALQDRNREEALTSFQNRSREEELIAQELYRLKQEELLRQQLATESELTNSFRLQEILASQAAGRGQRVDQQQEMSASALLRAALESDASGALAAQLRQLM